MHLILANILSIKQDALGSIEEMRKYLKDAPKAEDAPTGAREAGGKGEARKDGD